MSFTDMQNFSTPPKRICNAPFGNIFEAFPPIPIAPHDRLGYSFRIEPCNTVSGYNPDVCVDPADIKMTPDEYGAEKDAELRVIQAAFKCSSLGATDQELHDQAQGAIEHNLWRAVDTVIVSSLAAEATSIGAAAGSVCASNEAAQYLAIFSYCGTGILYTSTAIVGELYFNNYLVKEGKVFKDPFGNIVIPSSVALDRIYAFDSTIEIRVSDIMLLDQYAPGIRSVNDRIVRAEQIYTVALDNCAAGYIEVNPCT